MPVKKTSQPRSAARPRSATPQSRASPLGREAWIVAAREALIRDGIRGVEVGKLARRLKVTRGGFYWFFNGRKQLLDELLVDWEQNNSAAFRALLKTPDRNGMAAFQAVVDIWVNETGYSPAWDSAVRDWARVSAKVARAVRRVDDERIDVLKQLFLDMGHPDEEAFIRARITYFHQVGYYAMGVEEPREQRLRFLPLYTRVLTRR